MYISTRQLSYSGRSLRCYFIRKGSVSGVCIYRTNSQYLTLLHTRQSLSDLVKGRLKFEGNYLLTSLLSTDPLVVFKHILFYSQAEKIYVRSQER